MPVTSFGGLFGGSKISCNRMNEEKRNKEKKALRLGPAEGGLSCWGPMGQAEESKPAPAQKVKKESSRVPADAPKRVKTSLWS